MMKIFLTILLFFITTLAHGQTGPVTIHGQSFYDISDEQSFEQARIQCKQSATINAIKASSLDIQILISHIALNMVYSPP